MHLWEINEPFASTAILLNSNNLHYGALFPYRTAQPTLGSSVHPPAPPMTLMPMRLVAYHRVSTARQGRSGLGLDAQKAALINLAKERGGTVIASFTEVESGKVRDRPELTKALHLAKVTGATLAIAKLDRLSRNAAFLLTLRDSGVRFIAADMPEANDLTVGIMALVAQQEREAIARRTREALRAAKARGTKLGNPNGATALKRAKQGNAAILKAVLRNADAFAHELAPVFADIEAAGHVSLRAVAAELNRRQIVTRRGGRWHVSNVKNLRTRLRLTPSSSVVRTWHPHARPDIRLTSL